MNIVQANESRTTGPKYDHWPSRLNHISYVTMDGGFLCVTCANGGNGSRASSEDLNTEYPDDHQWIVIAAQENKTITRCDHCNRRIPTHV